MDEKYRRIKVLGKGSFGKAYLVKNTEVNELCVVKQMETSNMEPKERNEAVKEAMLLKRMDHANIVRFQEVFMTRKGRLCIVMDYADGGDVHQEIKRQEAEGNLLPEARVLEWFVQTCFALKHVHDRKVLHRDLKTQNIFLMATGQIKLGDFGIAKVLDATKDYAKTMVGTPYYLSPEIIEDRPYNFKSDIWSCGVVLYEMTTLQHPFEADSLVILASKILKDQHPPLDASYSPELAALIKSMLSKDAHLRPSVQQVLFEHFLQAAMHGANDKYSLGLDLSEFSAANAAALPPAAPATPAALAAGDPSAGAAGAGPQRPSLAERRRQEVNAVAQAEAAARADALGDRDTVLIGTVMVPPSVASSAAPAGAAVPGREAAAPPAETPEERNEGGDDEYEEEFEDYSGSEDGDKNPQSELRNSVANLKLGSVAAPLATRDRDQVAGEAGGSGPSAAACGEGAPPWTGEAPNTSRIGAKADSLRRYLQAQMPAAHFQKAYALVRASGEVSPEELQKQVSAVIGAEKAPELFTLFQLLCFLENVSSTDTEGAT